MKATADLPNSGVDWQLQTLWWVQTPDCQRPEKRATHSNDHDVPVQYREDVMHQNSHSGHAAQKVPASLQRIKAEAAAARRMQEAAGYTEVCTPDPRVILQGVVVAL